MIPEEERRKVALDLAMTLIPEDLMRQRATALTMARGIVRAAQEFEQFLAGDTPAKKKDGRATWRDEKDEESSA